MYLVCSAAAFCKYKLTMVEDINHAYPSGRENLHFTDSHESVEKDAVSSLT